MPIEIIIEPIAEPYTLLPGQTAHIENTLDETLAIDFNGDDLIIWEEAQFGAALKVHINDALIYPNWL